MQSAPSLLFVYRRRTSLYMLSQRWLTRFLLFQHKANCRWKILWSQGACCWETILTAFEIYNSVYFQTHGENYTLNHLGAIYACKINYELRMELKQARSWREKNETDFKGTLCPCRCRSANFFISTCDTCTVFKCILISAPC